MKKLMTLAFALTIAAALALTTTSCSNEDNLTEGLNLNQPQKVHVTVGAGINDAQTRSSVDYNTSTKQRTLKFTDGDRLYVRAVIKFVNDILGQPQEKYIMAGYLTIESIGANGTSATFTGDLDVFEGNIVTNYYEEWVVTGGHYECQEVEVGCDENGPIYEWQDVWVEDGEWEIHYDQPTACYINSYNSSSYNFTTPNPLDECDYVNAVLVHEDAGTHFSVNDDNMYWEYTGRWATDVATLMTTFLAVQGGYDSQSQSFELWSNDYQPILNCTISGLTAGATYDVSYLCGTSSDNMPAYDLSSFTADAQGKITFAFLGNTGDFYHAIRFINTADEYEWKLVNLGHKELEDKVYNVTKTAVDDPSAPVRPVKPTLSRSDGLDESELILGDPGQYDICGSFNDNGTPDVYIDDYYNGDLNMSISGNSSGYYFYLYNGGTVTLGGNGTASNIDEQFIYAWSDDLIVMLATDYTIVANYDYALDADHSIYLGVTSGTKRLTVTVKSTNYKGLCGNVNYPDGSATVGSSIGALAIDGCTVTLESETDNGDGTYTYVYTVTKN